MSYYNYLYLPVSPETNIDSLVKGELNVFCNNDEGFDDLVELIGEDFVHTSNKNKTRKIIFKPIKGGTDSIRPSDLLWNVNKNRKVTYGDPDCLILASEMEHHIDWSKVIDIDDVESALNIYKSAIDIHGSKLVIYPQ